MIRTDGFFDLQVNGFAGIDFNTGKLTRREIDRACDAMLACGVTGCLPTIVTAPSDVLLARLYSLDRAVAASPLGALMVPGYHLEGPVLNPGDGYAGCHSTTAMSPIGLIDRLEAAERKLTRPILLITVAPEMPGADALIDWARSRGKRVAIGHSAVSYKGVVAAADRGVSLSVHLGNGLPHSLHKLDNPIFAQLAEDRLWASFIADGIHMPFFALKVMLRAKGVDRSILISDAVSAAASPPGTYVFADLDVCRDADGAVFAPEQKGRYLAGSSLCLDQAVRNVTMHGVCAWDEAVGMASHNPRTYLLPAADAARIALPAGCIDWSETGSAIRRVEIGPVVKMLAA